MKESNRRKDVQERWKKEERIRKIDKTYERE